MLESLLRPFRKSFGRDKAYYKTIDRLFGFAPNNIELYKLALIHKSASLILENGEAINNERLEFLGDAIIEAVTSDYLYIEYPDRDEGFLTQMRSRMVSRQSLDALAVSLGLDKEVIANDIGMVQKHLFGDAFEAMMGAVYLDKGYNFVNRLLINNLYPKYINLEGLTESETDFKSRLIEWGQRHHYKVAFETKFGHTTTSHHPVFQSVVSINGTEAGYGTGDSKKEAEQRAAASMTATTTGAFSDEQSDKLLYQFDEIYVEEQSEKQ